MPRPEKAHVNTDIMRARRGAYAAAHADLRLELLELLERRWSRECCSS
jgi:hypothetical protein